MFFEIPAGSGTALKTLPPIYRWLKNWMFRNVLIASHGAWLRRIGLGSRWERIGKDIEFSIELARRPEGPERSRIALRSAQKTFDEVKVVVELYSGKVVQDETRIVSALNTDVRVVTLSDIPAYSTFADEDGIYSTYDFYKVKITSLVEDGVLRHVNLQSHVASPIDQTLANARDWKVWDGMILNISLIRWQQEALRDKWWHSLGHPQMGLGWAYSNVNPVSYLASVALLSKRVVGFVYWFPLVLRLRKFNVKDRGIAS